MDARSEVERCRAEFVAAFNNEDLAGIASLCAEDIILMPPNQPPIHGVLAALEWWSTGFDAGHTTMHVMPRELYMTDSWATEWFEWSVTFVALRGTVPVVDYGSTCAIWRRRNGEWQILRSMWRSHNETPSVWAGGVADFPIDVSPLM